MERYRETPLKVGGREIYMKYSMNKSGPRLESQASRVLVIRGVKDKVTEEWLTDFLKSNTGFHWDTDTTVFTPMGSRSKLEWRFASWRCQAEFIYHELRRQFPENTMFVTYGRDPCDAV